jgi:pimeloyl-ACP methyl ester carboxylesterase
MKGEHDPITCEKQVDAFRTLVSNGRFERFSNSGHWIRHEEPGRYIDTVLGFLSSVSANP